MKHSQQEIAFLDKEGLALLLAFSVEQNMLFFFPLNPFREISLLAQHTFGVDTADLTSFQKREGHMKCKTRWCHVSTNGRCCSWLFTEPPDQDWACLEDVVLSGVCHLRHTGVSGCWPVDVSICITPPPTYRDGEMGPHAPVWLDSFIILFHSVFVVSVTLSYFTMSHYPHLFSLSPSLDGIKSTLFCTG